MMTYEKWVRQGPPGFGHHALRANHTQQGRQQCVNSLRPRQNGRLFADDTFKRIFLNENIRISNENSLIFVPKGLINNIPALVLIMAWRRPGDKPLSEPMLVRSLTHICVARPQWVNVTRMIKCLSFKNVFRIKNVLEAVHRIWHSPHKGPFMRKVCSCPVNSRVAFWKCCRVALTAAPIPFVT